jgi:hypothetical protein
MIHHDPTERIEAMVMFRIISRHDWDTLQSWHRACPGSTVEHLYRGLYVLAVPAGGAGEEAA